MMNNHGFNEVFFENVRVPRANLLGEENRGWYMATTTLDFERSSIGGAVGAQRMLDELVGYTRRRSSNGHRLNDEPPVRWRLGEAAMEAELGRLLSYRVVTLQSRGQVPNYESSIAKLFNTDMQLRMAQVRPRDHGPVRPARPQGQVRAAEGPLRAPVPLADGAGRRRRHDGDPEEHHRHARAWGCRGSRQ